MIRQFRSTVAIAAITFALTSAVVPTTSFATGTAAVPTLVFYERPGCPVCKQIALWLDALKRDHPNDWLLERKLSTDPANRIEMSARGIQQQGLAILSPAGELSWSANSHTPITREDLLKAFNQFILGTSAAAAPNPITGAKPPVKLAAKPATTDAGDKAALATVIFYEIPGCPICKRINGWLDTLKENHPNKARFERKPSTDPANHPEMAARGVEHHGVAILSPEGQVMSSTAARNCSTPSGRAQVTASRLAASS